MSSWFVRLIGVIIVCLFVFTRGFDSRFFLYFVSNFEIKNRTVALTSFEIRGQTPPTHILKIALKNSHLFRVIKSRCLGNFCHISDVKFCFKITRFSAFMVWKFEFFMIKLQIRYLKYPMHLLAQPHNTSMVHAVWSCVRIPRTNSFALSDPINTI